MKLDTDIAKEQESRRAIAGQMVQQFMRAPNGGVDYAKAFEQHPDWRSEVGWDRPRDRQSFYNLVSVAKITSRKAGQSVANGGNKKGGTGRPWTNAQRAKLRATIAAKRNGQNGHATAPALPQGQCTLTGPGLTLSFDAKYLPEVLHTVAFAMGGGKSE